MPEPESQVKTKYAKSIEKPLQEVTQPADITKKVPVPPVPAAKEPVDEDEDDEELDEESV